VLYSKHIHAIHSSMVAVKLCFQTANKLHTLEKL